MSSLFYNKIARVIISPFFIAVIILLANIYPTFDFPMATDEGIWNYVGHIWVHYGVPPYIGSIENKTPGIFYLYAISNLLFGVNFWFPRLLAILSVVATSAVIYLISKTLYNKLAGALAMFLFGAAMSWWALDAYSPSQTETFMVLFSTLAFFIIIRAQNSKEQKDGFLKIFIAGLLMGAAIAFKQVAVFSLAGLFFYYLNSRKNDGFKNIFYFSAVLGAGVIFATFLSITPLLLSGVGIWDYVSGAWLILLEEGGSRPSSFYERLLNFIRMGLSEIILFYPFIIIFFSSREVIKKLGVPFLGIVLWMFFDFLGVNVSGHYFKHQLRQLMPSMAIASGIAINIILSVVQSSYEKFYNLRAPSEDEKTKYIVRALFVIMAVWLIFPNLSAAPSKAKNAEVEIVRHNREWGLFLKENTVSEDFIYIWGWHGNPIQAYSERRSPSRYFNSFYIRRPGVKEEAVDSIKARPPKFILLPAEMYLDGLSESDFTLNMDERSIPEELQEVVSQSYRYRFTGFIFDFYEFTPRDRQ